MPLTYELDTVAPSPTSTPHGQIFVVGPSRSGTSLLREALNRSSSVWVVRETHYFDDLRPRLANGGRPPLGPGERERCEAYFLGLGHRAYGAKVDPDASAVPRDALRQAAIALGDGGDAYFRAFCRFRATANGRPRWGEKTPRHAFRIAEMLEVFPNARVVCLIRDPRAVVASYRDWTRRPALDPSRAGPFAADRRRARRSYNIVLASLMCRAALEASLAARDRHGDDRVRLLVYEDLVRDSERSLRDLCGWLELDYEPAMRDVPLVQSSYAAAGAAGISTEPVERWRSKLSPAEVRVIESCCGRVMAPLGYERVRPRCSPLAVPLAWLGVPVATAGAAFANRRRLGRAGRYVGTRLRFALGHGRAG